MRAALRSFEDRAGLDGGRESDVLSLHLFKEGG